MSKKAPIKLRGLFFTVATEDKAPIQRPEGPPQTSRSPWQWVALGTGAAAGVAAVVTGTLSVKKADSVKSHCTDNVCPTAQEETATAAENLGIATNVLIGVAAAGAITGVVLILLEPDEAERSVALHPAISPGSAGVVLEGRF